MLTSENSIIMRTNLNWNDIKELSIMGDYK